MWANSYPNRDFSLDRPIIPFSVGRRSWVATQYNNRRWVEATVRGARSEEEWGWYPIRSGAIRNSVIVPHCRRGKEREVRNTEKSSPRSFIMQGGLLLLFPILSSSPRFHRRRRKGGGGSRKTISPTGAIRPCLGTRKR